MSAEALTELLQQTYTELSDTPFHIVRVVVNAPEDGVVNDVTVYLDKESATTVESLNDEQLADFAHRVLQDVFIHLAAPATCSLHVVYQFFDKGNPDYLEDDSYFIGEYWDAEDAFWIARTYLDFYYDEDADRVLTYRSWLNRQVVSYRPWFSKLLYFVDREEDFSDFLKQVVYQIAAEIPAVQIEFDEFSRGYKRCTIDLARWNKTKLLTDEYTTIVFGYRLFEYALRFYKHRIRRFWLRVTSGGQTFVSFDKNGRHCEYRSWLDDEATALELEKPVVFDGRAKRELKKYLTRKLSLRMLGIQVEHVKILDKDERRAVVTLSSSILVLYRDTTIKRLRTIAERLIWDVHHYYQQPRRCVLELRHEEQPWKFSVRLDERDSGYRIIPWSATKKFEVRTFEKDSLLARKSEFFQRDWDRYRYVYRPVEAVEA